MMRFSRPVYKSRQFRRSALSAILVRAYNFSTERMGQRRLTGYIVALFATALATGCIGFILSIAHFSNISLAYLIVVLLLAARYGRGPAIISSVLAFLAYDFFFIPPIHVLTINDPTEWISLFALLATSLVLGQLTAALQERAREAIASRQIAIDSQRRTAILYDLAQMIASTSESEALFQNCVKRIVTVFGSAGVAACTLITADERGRPITRASFPVASPSTQALDLVVPERAAQARWVYEHGSSVGSAGRVQPKSGDHQGQSVQPEQPALVLYLPLSSSQRVVGVIGIAGEKSLRRLLPAHARATPAEPTTASTATSSEMAAPAALQDNTQMALFAAFCDQIALAIDRFTFQQQAIHAAALRESDRLKDALLGSVTHDLRTPLAAIQASVGSLLETDISWGEAERHEFLETIETSADRLSRLVNNLLNLSRLEAGAAEPEKQWYPLENVIATVLDRLDFAGRSQGRHIDLSIPDDLPLVPMDHAQIEQVLTNLIENALKYSPADSPIQVQVQAHGMPPTELEVRIIDHGIGIPVNELNAIFDKFYRVQQVRLPWANNRPPAGTGLGLAICANIIRAHDGHIWAESQPGQGSTFIFTLPISQETPTDTIADQDQSIAEDAVVYIEDAERVTADADDAPDEHDTPSAV